MPNVQSVNVPSTEVLTDTVRDLETRAKSTLMEAMEAGDEAARLISRAEQYRQYAGQLIILANEMKKMESR